MYTELTFDESCENIHVVMESTVERTNEDLRKLLRMYLNNELDYKIRDRVHEILINNDLIIGESPTENGEKLRRDGTLDETEYGQYYLTYLNNRFTNDEDCFVTLKREKPSHFDLSKSSNREFSGHLYDCDQEKTAFVEGLIKRIREDKPSFGEFGVVIKDDDVFCSVSKLENAENVEVFTDMDSEHILEGCINDYSIYRSAVVVSNVDNLSEEQKVTLSADLSNNDVGKMVKNTVFDRPLKSFYAEDVPLCASNQQVAEKWIAELRKYWWKNEFVTEARAKYDQEYWSEKLTGNKIQELVKTGDELLRELRDSDAYWGIASMIDLMPDSAGRTPFFVSGDSDFDMDISREVFPSDVMDSAKHVVVVDSYPGTDSEKILRKWMDNRTVKVTFLVNKNRYEGSKGPKLEEKDLSEYAELKFDDRRRSESHSRYVLIMKKDGSMSVWGLDNSLNNFRLENNEVKTRAKMKFTPEPCLYDKELEKIVRELK